MDGQITCFPAYCRLGDFAEAGAPPRAPACQIVLICCLLAGNKTLGRTLLASLALHIEEAGDGEHHRPDKVHEEILHGVDDRPISRYPPRPSAWLLPSEWTTITSEMSGICHDLIGQGWGPVPRCRCAWTTVSFCMSVPIERVGMPNSKNSHSTPTGHGKAEGYHGQIRRGQVEGNPVIIIQQHPTRAKAHGWRRGSR